MKKGFALIGMVATIAILTTVGLHSWQVAALGYRACWLQQKILRTQHEQGRAVYCCQQLLQQNREKLEIDALENGKPLEIRSKLFAGMHIRCGPTQVWPRAETEGFLYEILNDVQIIIRQAVR